MQMIFQSLDWQQYDQNYKFVIHVFGRERDSNHIVNIKITGYKPYFYIKVKVSKVNEIIGLLKQHCTDQGLEIKQEYHKKFYDYRNNKENMFLKLSVSSLYQHSTMANVCQRLGFSTYESDLKPLFRFFYDTNIEPVSWISIDNYKSIMGPDEPTKPYYTDFDKANIYVNYRNVKQMKELVGFSNITIGSFDIETYSESRNFPQATNINDSIIQIGLTMSTIHDPNPIVKVIVVLGTCDQVSSDIKLIQCTTEQELIQSFLKVLDYYRPDILTGYNIYGYDFKYIYDRFQILGMNSELMHEWNRRQIKSWKAPQLKTQIKKDKNDKLISQMHYIETKGYCHFDLMHYIQANFQLAQNSLAYVSLVFLSKKVSKVQGTKVYIPKQDKSIVPGQYITFMVNDGYIDQQHKNGKKYRVTNVTDGYIDISEDPGLSDSKDIKYSITKDDISPQQIFEYQEKDSYHRSLVAKYCIQDCELVNLIIGKLLIIPNIISMANVNFVTISNIILNGQGIKAYSLISQFTKKNGYLIIDKSNKTGKPMLTNPIMLEIPYDVDIANKYPLTVNQDKQSMIVTSDQYRKVKKDIKNKQVIQIEDESNTEYQGAIVLDPKPELITDPVYVCDFQSLYPMSMICANISHEMYIRKKKYLGDMSECIPVQDIQYIEETGQTNILRTYYFKRTEGPNDIPVLTQVLNHLLEQRKHYRKLSQTSETEQLRQIYDAVQLAFKITANSIYGQLGTNKSFVFQKQLALCTTSLGRQMLLKAKSFTENEFQNIVTYVMNKDQQGFNEYFEQLNIPQLDTWEQLSELLKDQTQPIRIKTIYGDTDSIFNKVYSGNSIPIDRKIAIGFGNISVKLINLVLPRPQNLQYEKVLQPLIIISKKKYVGNLYENDPNSYVQKSMGIDIKKRSTSPICRLICGQIIKEMLQLNTSKQEIISRVKQCFMDILNGKYDIEYFIMTKKLQAGYVKDKVVNHQILADRMRDRQEDSSKYQIGSRIQYVFIDLGVSYKKYLTNMKQHEFMEDPDYVIKHKKPINYMFYLMKHIKKSCYDFLKLLDPNIDNEFEQIYQYGNVKMLGQVEIKNVENRTKITPGYEIYI